MSEPSPGVGISGIDALLRNNQAQAAGVDNGIGCGEPRTGVAVVACMDAIRNAGGVVSDDVIRSLLISQRLLGTREVMLVHHTDCGMLKFRDDELKQRFQAETGLELPFALDTFGDLDANLRRSIVRIKSSPYLPNADQVRGFVYEMDTGRLREVT